MFLAKVKHSVTATHKHPAYKAKRVFVVRRVEPNGKQLAEEWLAVDSVGAGIGDTVVCGGAPGAARQVFGLELAPIRTMIIAIVDQIDMPGAKR